MAGSQEWALKALDDDAQALHGADLGTARGVWWLRPSRPAFVLGSSQSDDDLDTSFCMSHGIDVARRRSGGGAVHVHPVDSIWVDIVIPRDDVLWVDDIARSMHFIGHAWCRALEAWMPENLVVNEGPHVANDWSKRLCVAGRGSGEVFQTSADGQRKVVGISQRRTRTMARFQCIAYLLWDTDVHVGAIRGLDADRSRLADLVGPVPPLVPARLVERLAAELASV